MRNLQALISAIRGLRKDLTIANNELTNIQIHVNEPLSVVVSSSAGIENDIRTIVEQNRGLLEGLARVTEITFSEVSLTGNNTRSTPSFDVAVIYEREIDVVVERERLTKDIAKFEKGLASAEKQLGNETFLAKAPANIVEGLKKQESETRQLLEKARAALAALPDA